MNLTNYAYAVKGKLIDVDGVYGSQCVDLVKDCVNKVFNITLGTFGWSARTGWFNNSGTFSPDLWERIENDVTNPNQVPEPGDVIFFNTGRYGHVGIVMDAKEGENEITVLDQNTWNWDGYWDDDVIKIQKYTYKDVYGWYHYNMNIREYKWVRVRHSDDFSRDKKGILSGKYMVDFDTIILTSLFYTLPERRQKAILEHEYAHAIYFKMPEVYREVWVLISEYDEIVKKALQKRWVEYNENKWVTQYASTSPVEDFAECIEEDTYNPKTYWDYRDVKVKIAKAIINKFK